jgi:hypothetical protein
MSNLVNPYRFGGGGPWEYADLATAEASGDPWVNGDEVTITGGAVFLYMSALAVSGYSGLIHKGPYGAALGDLSTIDSIVVSEAEGVDPDAWVDFTDGGTGTKGVDYDYDVSSGRARLQDLTTPGQAYLPYGSDPTSGELEAFFIIDRVTFSTTVSNNNQSLIHLALEVYQSAGNTYSLRMDGRTDGVGVPLWAINHTSPVIFTLMTEDVATEHRYFIYLKNGRWTVWADDSSTNYTGTVPRTGAASSRSGWVLAGHTSQIGSTNLIMGRFVRGWMTTA